MFLFVDNSDSPSVVEQLQQGCGFGSYTFISSHSCNNFKSNDVVCVHIDIDICTDIDNSKSAVFFLSTLFLLLMYNECMPVDEMSTECVVWMKMNEHK